MKTLQLTIQDSVAEITFSRPEALNAINSEVFAELNAVLDDLEKNDNLKALILTGDGKAFVAGADIAEMRDKSPDEAKLFSEMGHTTFARIEDFKVPVIAAVNGFALGGGLELALACDFIVASEKAKFSAPEVNLGLIPGFNGTQRLALAVGTAYAKYLIYTAEMINAAEAFRVGLVQKVVLTEELMETVTGIALNIASKGPDAVKAAKRAVNYGVKNGFLKGSENEQVEFSKQFNEQGKEGMTAFLEKRKPVW